ncbi:unnamed protein product [Dibothriocephalus latus]|uniref:Periphilin-1 C-terminal domain-containing protein n=1 Tax=Dibothriocephalus latus TaxID=60516 RepID=A0A3P7NHA6_DIBLA|nr:unnamed protein product [Dibothriocephalus latus]
MNYRRYHVDRVNPRDVLPSRHTIFVRGLPGSTNVDAVKDYFSKETNSKCSIAFSSMSEDRVRFSVAVRFKTNEQAREMLVKPRNEETHDNYHLPDQSVNHEKPMPQAGRPNRSRRSSSTSSSRSSSYDSCRRPRGSEVRASDIYRNQPAPISFDNRSSLSPTDMDSLPKKSRFEKVSDNGRSLPYTNMPAQNSESSGLLSGLIQLKRKPAGGLHARRRHSRSHSQSPVSSSSDTSSPRVPKEPRKNISRGKFSPSPPNFNEEKRLESKSRVRQTSSPSHLPADEREGHVSGHSADGNRWRPVDYPEDHSTERKSNFGRPVNGIDSADENSADGHRDRSQEPKLPSSEKRPRRLSPSPKTTVTNAADSVGTKIVAEPERNLGNEYKRDCETFATVVRTLISKDNELESRLIPLLKEILHERGQKCVEELRASITEEQNLNQSSDAVKKHNVTTAVIKTKDIVHCLSDVVPNSVNLTSGKQVMQVV